MNKKIKRFWYLLNYQDLISEKEKKEMQELYDELYDADKFTVADLEYIDLVW